MTSKELPDDVLTTPAPQDHREALRRSRAVMARLQQLGYRIPFIAGAELSLADFLDEDPVARAELHGRAQLGADEAEQHLDLLYFLGAQGQDAHLFQAQRIVSKAFSESRWLTAEPLLRRLSGLEHDGVFYRQYRDHVVHSLLVYVLGAYFVRRCGPLGRAMTFAAGASDDQRFSDFMSYWRLAALFHDVGYLLENDQSEVWRSGLTLLHDYGFGLLSKLDEIAAQSPVLPRIAPEDQRSLETELRRRLPPLRDVFDLFSLFRFPDQAEADAFAVLQQGEEAPRGLPNGFFGYFKLCRATQLPGRPAYLDHGIIGALMLLKLADVIEHFFDAATAILGDRRRHGDWADVIAGERAHFRAHTAQRVRRAATAIAVHNINPALHRRSGAVIPDAVSYPTRDYGVDLEQSPLSFVLRLTDTLQDWDRRYYRSPWAEQGRLGWPRTAQDIDLEATAEQITVRARVDDEQAGAQLAQELSDLGVGGVPLVSGPIALDQPLGREWFTLIVTRRLPCVLRSKTARERGSVSKLLRALARQTRALSSRSQAAIEQMRLMPTRQSGLGAATVEIDISLTLLELYQAGYTPSGARQLIAELLRAGGEENHWEIVNSE